MTHEKNEIIDEQRINFIFQIDRNKFAVYLHRIALTKEVIYVGFDRLSEVYNLRSVANNEVWKKKVAEVGGVVQVELIGLFQQKIDAMVFARDMRTIHRPATMGARNIRRQVRRIDTGEVYSGSLAAARAHNISQGAMSSHLNGRKNYSTVHGLRFEWCEPTAATTYAPVIEHRRQLDPQTVLMREGGQWRLYRNGTLYPMDTEAEAMEYYNYILGVAS